jgi:hypothetical protein
VADEDDGGEDVDEQDDGMEGHLGLPGWRGCGTAERKVRSGRRPRS